MSDLLSRRRALQLLAAATASGLAGSSLADQLKFYNQLGPAKGGPRRGMSMPEVANQFGEPTKRTGPIGDPPITVWHYPTFKVYFEHDHVIHAVAKRG